VSPVSNGGFYVHFITKVKKNRKLIVVAADVIIMAAVSALLYNIMPLNLHTDFVVFLRNASCLGASIVLHHMILHTYESLWRYAEAREYIQLSLGTLCGYMTYVFINIIFFRQYTLFFLMMTVSACSLVLSLVMRFVYRILRRKRTGQNVVKGTAPPCDRRDVVIIGAGSAGVLLLDEIRRNPRNPYNVWGFIDDDKSIIGRKIHDVEVRGPISAIGEITKGTPVSEAILAIPSLNPKRRQEILEICSHLTCRTKILPDMIMSMQSENLSYSASVRDIKPEDLLGRSSVHFQRGELVRFLKDRVILVTGGGGSIGSELCRQIASYGPKMLIIFDVFENNAYVLQQELQYMFKNVPEIQVEIGSIRDAGRIKDIFEMYRPDVVFHAAAHKHVPLMEHNPGEAIKNNIFGTYELLRAAAAYRCKKFVMISTDKAVNPTNVMGASKRYCEMMVQAMAAFPDCATEFVAVRFGNVLGSNGSVVPLFMKQIERGGPVTITDRRIIRYFMTIPEAASLVLQAGSMAHKSEIFVLDMGEPVKIVNMAENLIRLAGLTPYKDIQIVETGLRPGEKLYEELLTKDCGNSAASGQKIFIEKQSGGVRYSDIEKGLKKLKSALATGNNEIMINTLKELVPTFKTPEEVNEVIAATREEAKEAQQAQEKNFRGMERWRTERREAVNTPKA